MKEEEKKSSNVTTDENNDIIFYFSSKSSSSSTSNIVPERSFLYLRLPVRVLFLWLEHEINSVES